MYSDYANQMLQEMWMTNFNKKRKSKYTLQIKNSSSNWITEELLTAMKQKNKVYKSTKDYPHIGLNIIKLFEWWETESQIWSKQQKSNTIIKSLKLQAHLNKHGKLLKN